MVDTYHLTKIERVDLPDHYHLEADDGCYFYGEYTAGEGFRYSDTNQLIYNLKWSSSPYWRDAAKNKVAAHVAAIANLDEFTFVPVPPSKAKGDPEYDDRLMDVLRIVQRRKPDVDIREIITQRESLEASHNADVRPPPEQLQANYEIDDALLSGARNKIIIFDDMITAGAHYRAMVSALSQHRAGLEFKGLFVARRVPPNPFL